MDILFVNPNAKKGVYGPLASSLSGIEPPIWCGLKAAYVRNHGHTVKIVDAEAENLSPEQTAKKISEISPLVAEIIVMGLNPSASSTPKMIAVKELLTHLRKLKQDTKILLSGIHPGSLPERTLNEENTDFVCVGEGLKTTLELVETIKKNEHNYEIKGLWYKRDGKTVSNGIAEVIQDLDSIPFVAWDLLDMGRYRSHNWQCFHDLSERKPYAIIYTSLGCPFNCTYCNIHAMYECKPGIRFRSPEKVVEEIEMLATKYNVKTFKMLDELFVLNEDRVSKICDLIIERGLDLNIWAYARVDTVNENVLNKMKQAGINWLCYGIEAGSKKVRDDVHKGRFGQNAIYESIKMTHDAGIHVIGNFMFGLPEDDIKTMQDTLDMAKELNCEYVNFYTVMAYPGSQLYEDSVKSGARLPDTWLGFAQLGRQTTPLPSKYLTSEQILMFRDKAFEEYYREPKYLKMIEDKFGNEAVEHVNEMLLFKMERDLLKQ